MYFVIVLSRSLMALNRNGHPCPLFPISLSKKPGPPPLRPLGKLMVVGSSRDTLGRAPHSLELLWGPSQTRCGGTSGKEMGASRPLAPPRRPSLMVFRSSLDHGFGGRAMISRHNFRLPRSGLIAPHLAGIGFVFLEEGLLFLILARLSSRVSQIAPKARSLCSGNPRTGHRLRRLALRSSWP